MKRVEERKRERKIEREKECLRERKGVEIEREKGERAKRASSST